MSWQNQSNLIKDGYSSWIWLWIPCARLRQVLNNFLWICWVQCILHVIHSGNICFNVDYLLFSWIYEAVAVLLRIELSPIWKKGKMIPNIWAWNFRTVQHDHVWAIQIHVGWRLFDQCIIDIMLCDKVLRLGRSVCRNTLRNDLTLT